MASPFDSFQLAGLSLHNRIVKTATFEGMTPGGIPNENLIRHHTDLAKGGVGMTTVAYCGVSTNGRTFADQMHMHAGVADPLKRLTDSVHAAGAKVSGQMAHCGFFSKNHEMTLKRPLGPSFCLNAYGLMSGYPFGGAMSLADIDRTVEEYAESARFMVGVGFDALEIHMGHGYLLSQFISPSSNRRRDDYGGPLENRMRFPLRVVAAVREAVGSRVPILCKLNLSDGFRGGLELPEAVRAAQMLEAAGVDALVLSGGFTSKTALYLLRGGRPLDAMVAVEKNPLQKITLKVFGKVVIRELPFQPLFFMEMAKEVRRAVKIPLVYLGGITGLDDMQTVMDEGFELMAMGRALIADPDMINRLQSGGAYATDCNRCNLCVTAMDTPDGVRCVRFEDGYPQSALTAR